MSRLYLSGSPTGPLSNPCHNPWLTKWKGCNCDLEAQEAALSKVHVYCYSHIVLSWPRSPTWWLSGTLLCLDSRSCRRSSGLERCGGLLLLLPQLLLLLSAGDGRSCVWCCRCTSCRRRRLCASRGILPGAVPRLLPWLLGCSSARWLLVQRQAWHGAAAAMLRRSTALVAQHWSAGAGRS